MNYRILPQNGDSLAVPQLVVNNLARADEACIRVALYVLATRSTEPRDIAHALGLPSVQAAENALKWWAGAGLLEAERNTPAPPPAAQPLRQQEINAASLRDPMVAILVEETQAHLGRTLGHADLSRLVGLYLNENISPEVILLCAAHVGQNSKQKTIGALDKELHAWLQAGVETGEQAEQHLVLLEKRAQRETAVAQLLGLPPELLTLADRRTIRRWYEELRYDQDMIEEAILQAQDKKTIRYINGILKAWYARGLYTVQQVRGGGTLSSSESAALRVDRKEHSGHDILKRRPASALRLKRED